MSGIYDRPSPSQVSRVLQDRCRARMAGMPDDAVQAYLADAVYLERKRFHAGRHSDPAPPAEIEAIEAAARATHQGRGDQERAVLALVDAYAHEIHNVFSQRTYKVATRVIPSALSRLLTSTSPRELVRRGAFDPDQRLIIETAAGDDGAALRALAREHTLIFAPTHVSNLDSPLIGYALDRLGLPPAIYGAGLNLFSSPVMGFFMSRLGAYTVDRRKQHRLYKDVLKDYSIDSLGRRCHSLFFPGGTRCRSGRVEDRVKKGLLGTGIIAWQEGLLQGRPHPEVLVVPVTLSFSLVLEAETLIEDSLEEEGKRRYIITDDEFSEPRTVATFARQVLELDDAIVLRFGAPLDLLGNPVDPLGRSLDKDGLVLDRRAYVTDAQGRVARDDQRDHVYTDILSRRLVDAWHRDSTALSTHVACFAAGRLLRRAHPRRPTAELVLLPPAERPVARADLLAAIAELLAELDAMVAAGRIRTRLPGGTGDPQARATAVLDEALRRFRGFHSRRTLEDRGGSVGLDPRLVLYYGHRLHGYGLQGEM
ncbi:1-acyl-sn-glycerol-3-phosphate acyltransferase [Myxococcota bacterium]|nr:1-acyl-sn-glycerol-3-phosphate acyltransferase [Myxococcota bacterium]